MTAGAGRLRWFLKISSTFTGVSAVTFGGMPAESYSVLSTGKIVAVAPAAAGPGRVSVAVTTIARVSVPTPDGAFIYTACVVPKLLRRKLDAVREALGKADVSSAACGAAAAPARAPGWSARPRSRAPFFLPERSSGSSSASLGLRRWRS